MEPAIFAGVLSTEPLGPLASFLRIAQDLGVKWRILSKGPFYLWCSLPEVERLWYRPEIRQWLGIREAPANWGELRRLVKLRRDHGDSYQEICDLMESQWICTGAGLREWRRSTILQYLERRADDKGADRKLEPGTAFLDEWIRFVMDKVLVHLFQFAPRSLVEFGVGWRAAGTRVIVESDEPVPDVLSSWAVERMAALNWFHPHDWGTTDSTTPAQTATP